MNYDSMTDRELDAAVAEKVMGWSPGGIHNPPTFWVLKDKIQRSWEDTSFGAGFRPATEIYAAFEVVEAMRERGYSPRIQTAEGDESVWHVQLWSDPEDNPYGSGLHEKLPRAICIAALSALDE